VNARKRTVKGNEVSFEQIVQLAFPGSHDPNVAFSMTYRHAASEPHAGELGPGGHVKVKNGTIFNVTKPFDRNPDLRKLREEGYAVRIRGGFLVMQVPYVDGKGEVRLGRLISSLTLAGDVTQRPDTHVVHWDGDYPATGTAGRSRRCATATAPSILATGSLPSTPSPASRPRATLTTTPR